MNKGVKMLTPECTALTDRKIFGDFEKKMEDHLISKDGDGHGVRIKFAAFALLIKNEEDMKRLHSILISGFSEPSGPMHTGGDTHGYQRDISRDIIRIRSVIEIITLEDEMEPDHQDILNRCPYVNKLFGPYIQEVEKDHKSTPTAKASFVAKLMKYKNVYKDLYCSNPPPQKTEVTGVSLDPEGKLQLHWSGKVLVKGEKLEKGVHEEAEREHGIKTGHVKGQTNADKINDGEMRPEKRAQKRRGDDDEEDLTSYTPFEDPAGHKRYIGNNDDDDDEREFKEAAPKPKKAKKTSTDKGKGSKKTEVKLVKKGRLPASSEEEEEVETAKAVTQGRYRRGSTVKVSREKKSKFLVEAEEALLSSAEGEEVKAVSELHEKRPIKTSVSKDVVPREEPQTASSSKKIESIIFVEESSPSTIEAPKKRGEEKITQGDRVEEETADPDPPDITEKEAKGKGKVVKGRGKSQKDKDYDFPQFVTAKSPLNTLKAIGERLSLKGNEYRTAHQLWMGIVQFYKTVNQGRRTPALPTEIPVEKLGIFRSLIEE
ncbi:hypothetical protein BC829DRAFT_422845 [Chytridium lagenaria]|nr:hypothetical protein BC829DRAFT_422845 [Chytridium lagenaria]